MAAPIDVCVVFSGCRMLDMFGAKGEIVSSATQRYFKVFKQCTVIANGYSMYVIESTKSLDLVG